MHDEIIGLNDYLDHRNIVEGDLRQAMDKANAELNLNVKLDIDVQFGDNYGDVH